MNRCSGFTRQLFKCKNMVKDKFCYLHVANNLKKGINNVEGDGNCFWRCVSLYIFGTETRYLEIEDYVKKKGRRDIHTQLDDTTPIRLKKTSNWVELGEIISVSRYLGIPFRIHLLNIENDGKNHEYLITPNMEINYSLQDMKKQFPFGKDVEYIEIILIKDHYVLYNR